MSTPRFGIASHVGVCSLVAVEARKEATMYQNILLCTDGSPAADVATDYAIWFGKKLNASLRVLYVTDIRLLEGPWIADFSGAIGAQPYSALLPQLQQIQREKAATVLAAVEKRCRDGGVACETVLRHGQSRADHSGQGRKRRHDRAWANGESMPRGWRVRWAPASNASCAPRSNPAWLRPTSFAKFNTCSSPMTAAKNRARRCAPASPSPPPSARR